MENGEFEQVIFSILNKKWENTQISFLLFFFPLIIFYFLPFLKLFSLFLKTFLKSLADTPFYKVWKQQQVQTQQKKSIQMIKTTEVKLVFQELKEILGNHFSEHPLITGSPSSRDLGWIDHTLPFIEIFSTVWVGKLENF